jgi:hypothetical protein
MADRCKGCSALGTQLGGAVSFLKTAICPLSTVSAQSVGLCRCEPRDVVIVRWLYAQRYAVFQSDVVVVDTRRRGCGRASVLTQNPRIGPSSSTASGGTY